MPNIPVDSKASSKGNPTIGYWMIDSDGLVAHWLGDRKINGKEDLHYTLEPINMIFIVHANSNEDATIKVDAFLMSKDTGFFDIHPKSHTSGYKGYIDGHLYNQYENKTYSNNHPFLKNEHVRLFDSSKAYGEEGNSYVITGSCSEESGLFTSDSSSQPNSILHHFVSFNHCRNLIEEKSKEKWLVSTYIDLRNKYEDANFSTRDHDGKALEIII